MDSVATNRRKSTEDVRFELNYEIEEDVEAELEDFVGLNHTGQFTEAHELFDECLSNHSDWYPVAAEYADCLLRQDHLEQLAAFCGEAANRFSEPSERVILRSMELIGQCVPKNAFLELWPQLLGLWSDQSLKPPYTSLKDTDIHHLEIILQILVLAEELPKDITAILHLDNVSAGPWITFKDWFQYLLRHGYFWEAQRIFQSLLLRLPQAECKILVSDYIKQAVSTGIGQETVQIALSSLVQRFIFVAESACPYPFAVIQWSDTITWALFGTTLAGVGEGAHSMFALVHLRQSIQERLGLNIILPLDGMHENDERNKSLLAAVRKGDVFEMQNIEAEGIHDTWHELASMALLDAAEHCREEGIVTFLNGKTVNAQDGFLRTSLHWASSTKQERTVRLLLKNGADSHLVDWFGCTALHNAIRTHGDQGWKGEYTALVELLLKDNVALVNIPDIQGLTPLHIAIQSNLYETAELLLQHNAAIDARDLSGMTPLALARKHKLSDLENLLAKYRREPVSKVHSSMDAIIEAASAGFNLSLILNALAVEPGILRPEFNIHNLARDISCFCLVLKQTGKFMQEEMYITSYAAVDNATEISRQGQHIFEELRFITKLSQFRDADGVLRSITIAAVNDQKIRKHRVKYLLGQLESLQLTLTLMIQILQLASAKTHHDLSTYLSVEKQMIPDRTEILSSILVQKRSLVELQRLYGLAEGEAKERDPSPLHDDASRSYTAAKQGLSIQQLGLGFTKALARVAEISDTNISNVVDHLLQEWTQIPALDSRHNRPSRQNRSLIRTREADEDSDIQSKKMQIAEKGMDHEEQGLFRDTTLAAILDLLQVS